VTRTLDVDSVRRYYDWFGARQDSQAFYEDAGLDLLARESDFARARRVFELGCGTGRFAERLLAHELPVDARYEGVDLSSTMTDLATRRLARFGERAHVTRTEGDVPLPFPDGSFDRFVATYVLDILGEERIRQILVEAHRLLAGGGLLCTLALTEGTSLASRLVSGAWSGVYALRPSLVGGCRPISVVRHLDRSLWTERRHGVVVAWAVPSEVLVAEAV
jgi:ubiquinone/menaquinone biosynthesis C-methylase UbiE